MSVTLEEITPSASGAGAIGRDSRRWGAGHFTDLKKGGVDVATLASPALTGTPTAPTPSAGDNSTRLATTAYVDNVTGDVAANTASRHTQNTDTRLDQGGSNEVTAASIRARLDAAGALSAKDTVATADIDSEAVDDTRLKKNGTVKSTSRYYGTDSEGDLGFYDLPDVSGGYNDENARDAIGAALSNTDSITFNPDDGAETIEADLKRKTSGLTSSQGSLGVGSSGVYVDLGQTSGKAAAGDDSRFPTSDEKAAMTSAASPTAGNPFLTQSALAGIKLDDLATPDDNTDLDASSSRHGLLPKADKVKLDSISALSNASDSEVTTGTLTTQRHYTPAQLKLAAETHGGAGLPIDDTNALVRDPVDNTKQVRLDAGLIGTGQTRVIQAPDGDARIGLVPFQLLIADTPIDTGVVHWMWMPANFTLVKVYAETVSPGTNDITFRLKKDGTNIGSEITIGTSTTQGGGEVGELEEEIVIGEGSHLEVDITGDGTSGSSGASLGPVTVTILGFFHAL